MNSKTDVAIVGAGYVGLTLALHMASHGLKVLAIDKDEKKVMALQNGETTVFETGIKESLIKGVRSGNLHFASSTQEEIPAWILAISYFPGDKQHYLRVLKSIRGKEGEPPVIMIRGTIPVGYIRSHLLPALEKQFKGSLDHAFYLASAPERSLSGAALEELANLPQLIGGTPKSIEKASQVFEKSGVSCVPLPSFEAGELAKTFTNFTRLVQFNLSNFLGVLCHQYNVSEETMIEAIKAGYPRLNFLSPPGPGVGGFCLPKDSLVLQDGLKELTDTFEKKINEDHLWEFPRKQYELNENIIHFHQEKVAKITEKKSRILALGIAFKGRPQTDDTRASVGLEIVKNLLTQGRTVEVFDRTVPPEKIQALELPVAPSPLDLSRFDAVLLLNNDLEYKNILLYSLSSSLDKTVTLYDPWRLIVTGKESIFQENFSWQTLKGRTG